MDSTDIDATHEQWRDAYRRKDPAAVERLLTRDYVLWAPGREALTLADILPRLQAAFEAYDCSPAFERIELMVSGDLAVDVGWDIQHLAPRAGGPPIVQRQRVAVMLRRGEDGVWRYARGMAQPGPAA